MIPRGADALEAMRERVSVRSYTGEAVEARLLDDVMAAASEADHVSATPPRVALIDGVERAKQVLTFVVGSYGLIQNPPHLLAGILPSDTEEARIDLGYVMEQVVLAATAHGLGSCWVTGTYDAQAAGNALSVGASETVAAVCALGYASTSGLRGFHTKAVRALVGARRKPLEEIVFRGDWGTPWSARRDEEALHTALAHCRVAPSASNRQPWRFIVGPDDVTLCLARSKPIDAGIVMAHFALAADAVGIPGRWRLQWRDSTLGAGLGLPDGAVPVGVFA